MDQAVLEKAPFLRCLAMLTMPDKGDVFLREECLTKPGANLNKARARIGFVFQHIYLFRHLTTLECRTCIETSFENAERRR